MKNNKARVSIYNGHYIHTVTFDDAGNVQNISEEYIEKTYNRYSKGIPNEKKDRLEEVKRFAILGYKTEPSNILDYNVKIKEYEFIFTLNKLGFIEKFSKKIIKASQYESRQLNAFYKDLNIEQDEKKENLAKLMVVNAYQSYPQNKKFIQDAEKEALMGAADIITNTGEKISKHLGEKYKTIANEIASDLRNFQGKKLRSLSDALKMMEKINRNPNIKIKQADRVVLANAVRHVDTKILSENFQRLGKSFGVLGKVLSVEKLREKAAMVLRLVTGNH
ncbi:colicin-like pore-forming protein (plasmid) [Proteus mirabilis]|uniref:colicin-like pore-forming protein n=1 Tax=Proteus mirabilis TaxID=584 RepID=UPI001E5E35BA|nr:colicin-like pore-forming protein [Proteus mirabilis]UHD51774.1 colicin-like pore-forming protein [Proteus mirabilis]